MNANYPVQTRDARPALLLLVVAALLLAAWSAANGFPHLDLQVVDVEITMRDASQAGLGFQAARPPEPPGGGWQTRPAEVTPAPPSGSKLSEPALSPVVLPVATPPSSQ